MRSGKRHRLRRALGLLATAALAVPVSVVVATPAQASSPDFDLHWSPMAEGVNKDGYAETFAQVIADLRKEFAMVTFDKVVRDIQPQASCSDGIPDSASTLCFSAGDDVAEEWIPQGVTTYNDAYGGGVSPIFVSWYDGCNAGEIEKDWGRKNQGCQTDPAGTERANPKGARVSIYVAGQKYKNVLLVEPFNNSSNNPSFHATHLHAGGLALYGRYLFVPDTSYGFRVFDTQQIFDLSQDLTPGENNRPWVSGDKTKIGRHNNKYYSAGYRYIWPVVGEWKLDGKSKGGNAECYGDGNKLKFSYASIDRSTSPARLLAGEYCVNDPPEDKPKQRGRVVRWRLTMTSNPSAVLTDGGEAEGHYYLPVSHVQGAVSRGNTFYFHTSDGQNHGTLHKYQLSGSNLVKVGTRQSAVGPEDLSYDTSLSSPRIFSVSEYYGKRAIFYMPAF